jgi:plastocyanin
MDMRRAALLTLALALVTVACGDDETANSTALATTATPVTEAAATTVTSTSTTLTPTTAAPTTSAAPSTTATTSLGPIGVEIVIEGFDFGLPVTATTGDVVTVTNRDGAGHTWTADDGTFDSGTLRGGESFQFTFEAAGTYAFFCAIHPGMTGTITVTG